MTTIKFRAWYNNTMWYSLPWRFKYNNGGFSHFFNGHNASQKEVILMQFTGLKDKNGKEIYEGDIVHVPEGYGGDLLYKEFIGIVDYDPPVFYINQQESIKKTRKWHGQEYGWDELEIIGNIYENPEQIENNPG